MASKGSFNRTRNCQLDTEIVLTGDLSIVGRPDLTTITADPTSRHFRIATETLQLAYVKLTGGFRMASLDGNANGGSIAITSSGTLKAAVCWFHSNRGYAGGSIDASGNHAPSIHIVDTNITNSTAELT